MPTNSKEEVELSKELEGTGSEVAAGGSGSILET